MRRFSISNDMVSQWLSMIAQGNVFMTCMLPMLPACWIGWVIAERFKT